MRTKPTRFSWLDRVAAYSAPEKIKAILWPLAYHANQAGESHPSIPTLAAEAGCGSPDTARRRLHLLAVNGVIEILPRHVPYHADGKTLYVNLYRLKLPKAPPARPCKALQGHSGETTLQNAGDDLAKQRDDLARLCKANPILSPDGKPIPETGEGKLAGLPDDVPSSRKPDRTRIDYEKAEPPEIKDYTDIHNPAHDPVLVAMAITGERDKRAWGHWVKVLNQARRRLDPERHGRAERLFRGCLAELFGEMRAGEVEKPGALLNQKLESFTGRAGPTGC